MKFFISGKAKFVILTLVLFMAIERSACGKNKESENDSSGSKPIKSNKEKEDSKSNILKESSTKSLKRKKRQGDVQTASSASVVDTGDAAAGGGTNQQVTAVSTGPGNKSSNIYVENGVTYTGEEAKKKMEANNLKMKAMFKNMPGMFPMFPPGLHTPPLHLPLTDQLKQEMTINANSAQSGADSEGVSSSAIAVSKKKKKLRKD
mmetsp:Transcript_23641/g.24610  ORF Transcript_23641/g.24610 Transcript_23641/m.24610 type:complete len:205 (-) Transcript_23641:71-685(-)|eukprot:CAMPEP_0170536472 /NCGR_PEP_ID=MMETSP0209-20121228/102169_1 /TAXON_ID=665100 ORGANISM="Litonotus pictus, Strain P1" /NCGR_SAMPLE_ID=MMETSP0209 /ASSEMBLY_ACC=CAM_ASM_000301 /LENGTH=204 /DNA_ID=CAMNT_0010837841 /DNA_START=1 /DNA_END=615 /DNA_ORIENTATION=+